MTEVPEVGTGRYFRKMFRRGVLQHEKTELRSQNEIK